MPQNDLSLCFRKTKSEFKMSLTCLRHKNILILDFSECPQLSKSHESIFLVTIFNIFKMNSIFMGWFYFLRFCYFIFFFCFLPVFAIENPFKRNYFKIDHTGNVCKYVHSISLVETFRKSTKFDVLSQFLHFLWIYFKFNVSWNLQLVLIFFSMGISCPNFVGGFWVYKDTF